MTECPLEDKSGCSLFGVVMERPFLTEFIALYPQSSACADGNPVLPRESDIYGDLQVSHRKVVVTGETPILNLT